MKKNVNNNEMWEKNCVLEQVYRIKDIARVIECYETEGCDHAQQVRSLFTYRLFSDVTST
jgi:hypothetical protein